MSMKASVVGLGKIGLPLAVQFAQKMDYVYGIDTNNLVVDQVNRGIEPFPGEDDLGIRLVEVIKDNKFLAVNSYSEAIRSSQVVVIVVPLYIDKDMNPDFKTIDSATASVGKYIQPGTLISFETTLPVGSTRLRLTPILERESGLKVGKDFFVVFSPERVLSGRIFSDLRKYPKLVGGVDSRSTQLGIEFYESVLDFDSRPDLSKNNGVWDMHTSEAAELTKLAETTYRDVNIALANQFALFAENNKMNIYEVIEAANSQSFSHIHNPGIAVGGHCIPVYPHLYLYRDPAATVISAARSSNSDMPSNVIARMKKHFGDLKGKNIVVLGACYRGGVKETAFSGVFDLYKNLIDEGAVPTVHDSLFSDDELIAIGLNPFQPKSNVDFAIVQADHSEYRTWTSRNLPGLQGIVDGRNILNPSLWSDVKILKLGVSG
jgi:nucleotide sugar dehydrogenase